MCHDVMLQRQHLISLLQYLVKLTRCQCDSYSLSPGACTLKTSHQNGPNATVNASLIKVMCKRIICIGNCDIWSMTQMDMNGTVNQRDSINYNWPLLAVTQGLLVSADTQRLLFQKLLTIRQTHKHMCSHTNVFTLVPKMSETSAVTLQPDL